MITRVPSGLTWYKKTENKFIQQYKSNKDQMLGR